VRVDNLLDDPQAEPGAILIRRVFRLEHVLTVRFGDARARVRDLKAVIYRADGRYHVVAAVFYGVTIEVLEQVLEPTPVGFDDLWCVSVDCCLSHLHSLHTLGHLRKLHWFSLVHPVALSCQRQQVVDDCLTPVDGVCCHSGVVILAGLLCQFETAFDSANRAQ
jgi:hypothetical protein